MSYDSKPILVCTLGGKAQILTFALDALLKQKIEIGKVVVIHHASLQPADRLRQALQTLSDQQQAYYKNRFTLHEIAIRNKNGVINDLTDSASLSAVWETLDRTIDDLKKQHSEIHFCFTGGRRLLAMQAMSVLSLHATPSDHLWHLFTPPLMQEQAGIGKILHAAEHPDLPEPYLVRVPLVPWAYFFKGLRELLKLNPTDAIRLSASVLDDQEEKRCLRVWSRLPPRKRELFQLIIEGKSPQEAATVMTLAYGTVSNYLQDIAAECRNEWELGSNRIPYQWLQQRFAPYLSRITEISD